MRAGSLCLIVLALIPMAGNAAEVGAVVRKSAIDVYSEPKFESSKLTRLERDATVTVGAQHGLWYELKLPDGKSGFVRVNDVRVNYGKAEDNSASMRALTGGTAGAGRVTETAGVRGIDESDLKSAAHNQAQLDVMNGSRAEESAAASFASEHGWQATRVAFDGEARPRKAEPSASGSGGSAAATVRSATGFMGALGQKVNSALGTAGKVAPKPEQQLAAEELALGPQIAGRVLGARPLWNDAGALQRVNLVGRWVASQTSRPGLPWTFGVIDTPEINAFAAPGGYVMVTRGLYELLSSDSELAAVLGHEISHCVERDHYGVIRKQELAALGKDTVSEKIASGGNLAQDYARQYVERHGATILMTSLDREAEYRADQAAEIYLARSGMNPMALYAVLQKMTALGSASPSLAQLYKTHPLLDERMDRIDDRGYGALQAYTGRE